LAGPAQFLIEAFEARYRRTPDVYRAPGRVNLIGEHTDYNQGFVLPIAIDLACYAASAPNRDGVFRVYSLNLELGREWPVSDIANLAPAGDWTDYVIGIARQIPQTRGRDILFYSSVPIGSGLSSSAALEVASALAAGWDLENSDRLELAKMCKRAENEFVGVPSGIMDQYACLLARQNAALLIDCRSLASQPVDLPDGVAIIAVDTMMKHALGDSAYRQRVSECAEAVANIRRERPNVENLRDATLEHLPLVDDELVRRRARHVITENQRVLEVVQAARRRGLEQMGRLFVASHRSLQHDYEVSCEELDFVVDTALTIKGVYGARMTGGGFGGCAVVLLRPEALDRFESSLRDAYQSRFARQPTFYSVRAAAGAGKVS
jgi:galactokinase